MMPTPPDPGFQAAGGPPDAATGSPQHFEDLEHTDPDAGLRQRWQRLMPKLALIGGTAAAVIAVVAAALLVGYPLGRGPNPGPAPSPSPAPVNPVRGAATPGPSIPAVPTAAPMQVVVSGPETYDEPAHPYRAAYDLRLRYGGSVSVSLDCPACLTRGSTALTLTEGDEAVVEVVVPPASGDVELSLLVGGTACADWVLAPATEPTTFAAVCSP